MNREGMAKTAREVAHSGSGTHPHARDLTDKERLRITEAHVQQTIVQFLELDGWRAIRTDPVSEHGLAQRLRQAIMGCPALNHVRDLIFKLISRCIRGTGFGELGMPDYLFVRYLHYCKGPGCSGVNCFPVQEVKAQVMWIEFKRPGQKPKPHQVRWIEAERARGALVMLVDDIDAAIAWYKASGLNRRMR